MHQIGCKSLATNKAQEFHGEGFLEGVRIILGDSIPTKDGNFREKGVDALLVADLIYHAASKNCDYAILVTHDTDFVHALKRVEDFGCKSGLIAFCVHAPDRLQKSCDDYQLIDKEYLLRQGVFT